MNRLDPETRCRVVACLVEGNSIRATVRMTGAAKNTVVKLLKDLGKACLEYQDKTLVNLPCKRIQCDEIWSFCERQNLTMRMSMRRFTRLTNAFSKKVENHEHALSLYFMYYNFARIHQTLRVTPAMEAGVSNHVWSIQEIVNLIP